jgi:hypothetical protein
MSSSSPLGRIYNGTIWTDVVEDVPKSQLRDFLSLHPVTPTLDGDGKIHVSIVSFRGMI